MVVVVPVAESGQSSLVEEGAKLAEAFGEELHVIHVVDADVGSEDIGTSSDRSRETLREIARERAAEATGTVEGRVPLRTEGLVGEDVAGRIVAYAKERDASYVVIGGRKRSPVGKALFGSVAQSVLLNADRPVVSVLT